MNDCSIVVFDGYRGQVDPGSETVRSLAAATGASGPVHRNTCVGPGDSLEHRSYRFVSWLRSDPPDVHGSVHLVAYSMGCHVAVRSALNVSESRRLVGMDLIAPDPKFRECELDRIEAARGERSAFDEARVLWDADTAGPAFCAALGEIVADAPCRIVYSRDDEVAEWSGNVELMRLELAEIEGITWIQAAPGQTVRDHGITVSVQLGDEVHQSLAKGVRFC